MGLYDGRSLCTEVGLGQKGTTDIADDPWPQIRWETDANQKDFIL